MILFSLGKIDDFLEKVEPVKTLRRRIVRKVDDQHLRFRPALADRFLHLRKIVDAGSDRHLLKLRRPQ